MLKGKQHPPKRAGLFFSPLSFVCPRTPPLTTLRVSRESLSTDDKKPDRRNIEIRTWNLGVCRLTFKPLSHEATTILTRLYYVREIQVYAVVTLLSRHFILFLRAKSLRKDNLSLSLFTHPRVTCEFFTVQTRVCFSFFLTH